MRLTRNIFNETQHALLTRPHVRRGKTAVKDDHLFKHVQV